MPGFKFVDDINFALAADNLIIRTDFLGTGTHFHRTSPLASNDFGGLKYIDDFFMTIAREMRFVAFKRSTSWRIMLLLLAQHTA